jgi:alpha-amylase
MHRITLSLVLHNHQPVGNFDHIFAEATDASYAPMIAALERHPRIRLALHYSGPLLDWLRLRRPELLRRVRALVARGQVEILTGGYYEPILSIIPDTDKRGQIEKMTRAVAETFGAAAEGFWLAERVWEPHLARPLGEAGVRYTIVDDSHFHGVGLQEPELLGYYVTDEEGVPLTLFPSLRALRYLIPWAPVEEVIAYLRTLAETDARLEGREALLDLALMGDDGEKFGLWPTSFAHCWERGWVDRFFEAIETAGWIETAPPGEYLRTREPAGRIYLPTGTYDEMAGWALPPGRTAGLTRLRHDLETGGQAELVPFVRGGFWRYFLVKYPEANTLYRLALRAGKKVHAMQPGPEKARALDDLWAGECNCTYWHGVFGGVYLPHIRGAAFSHLIAAEAIADRSRRPGSYAEGETADLDGDGRLEVLLSTDQTVLTVDPARGGSLVEWDDRPERRNLGNVLTRRREAYHADLARAAEAQTSREHGAAQSIHTAVRIKEPGLERLLVYDRIRRAALRVRLLPPGVTPGEVQRDEPEDVGGFASGGYAWELKQGGGSVRVRLTREAEVGDGRATIERSIEAPAGRRGLVHATRLVWNDKGPLEVLLAEEWDLGVFGDHDALWIEGGGDRISLHEPGELSGASRLEIVEEHSGLRVALTPSVPARAWSLPLMTISNSEGGYERNYQGVMLFLCWHIRLAPGETWTGATAADVVGLRPPS